MKDCTRLLRALKQSFKVPEKSFRKIIDKDKVTDGFQQKPQKGQNLNSQNLFFKSSYLICPKAILHLL